METLRLLLAKKDLNRGRGKQIPRVTHSTLATAGFFFDFPRQSAQTMEISGVSGCCCSFIHHCCICVAFQKEKRRQSSLCSLHGDYFDYVGEMEEIV